MVEQMNEHVTEWQEAKAETALSAESPGAFLPLEVWRGCITQSQLKPLAHWDSLKSTVIKARRRRVWFLPFSCDN
jgi:hypothetical protein